MRSNGLRALVAISKILQYPHGSADFASPLVRPLLSVAFHLTRIRRPLSRRVLCCSMPCLVLFGSFAFPPFSLVCLRLGPASSSSGGAPVLYSLRASGALLVRIGVVRLSLVIRFYGGRASLGSALPNLSCLLTADRGPPLGRATHAACACRQYRAAAGLSPTFIALSSILRGLFCDLTLRPMPFSELSPMLVLDTSPR